MAAISRKLRSVEGGRLMFWCPGCDGAHMVTVKAEPGHPGPVWGYNENADAPTFTPSILVNAKRWHPPVTGDNLEEWKRKPWKQEKVSSVCHSFVTDGKIQFLNDCTHALAGEVVDLPDFD